MTIATGLTPTFAGAEPYKAPYGKQIKVSWVAQTTYQFDASPYSAPLLSSINFSFQTIASGPQELYPPGVNQFQFGTIAIQYDQALHPEGFANFVSYADGLLYNKNQLVYTYPFTGQPLQIIDPEVYNKLQFLRPGGLQSGFIAGNVWVSNYYRWVYAEPGLMHTEPGYYHSVQLGRRYLTNVYIETTITDFGEPFVAWENRDITATGFNATYFGNVEVADKAHYLRPVGRASTLVAGTPLVRDRAQRLNPFGVDMSLFGYMVIDLWKKEIKPASMEQWPIEATRFGPYRSVLNRNRKLLANGFVHSVLPQGGFVLNKARPIRPYGEVQTRFGVAFAAARIRYVTPEWYDTTMFSYDTVVRTRKMIVLDGWGFKGPNMPLPSRVWSNMQFIKPFATYEQTTYGRQWVDKGLRSLSPHSMLTQPAGDPFVAYGTRYIRPLGIEKGYVGTHQLETHQNIIKVWGYYHGGEGVPNVRNVTPEIKVFGAFAFEPGIKPMVQLLRRTMYAYGIPPNNVGEHFASDRMRRIRWPGIDYLRWGNGRVMFDQSQLVPPQQLIVPDSVQAGAGIVPVTEWEFPEAPWTGEIIPLGYPRVKLNTIFAPSLTGIETFGEPTTRSMVIFAQPGPSSTTVGSPTMMGGTKWIGNFASTNSAATFGYPNVVGPQYVRCGEMRNVQDSTWFDWDFHSYGDPQSPWYEWRAQTAGPTFGYFTTITNFNRKIYPLNSPPYSGGIDPTYGRPHLTHKPQRIRPLGFSMYKRGMPDVSYKGDKPIYVFDMEGGAFGYPVLTVEDWGPKWLHPSSFGGEQFGTSSNYRMRVELLHRKIYPSAWESFVHQRVNYVGPYLRMYPKSFMLSSGVPPVIILDEMTTYGRPYIDYKHRRVYPADVTDDRPNWTATVRHAGRGYFIEGTPSAVQFGKPDVGGRVKFAYLGGWEEFDTGFSYVPDSYPGLSNLHAQSFIATAHNEMMEFGNGTISHN